LSQYTRLTDGWTDGRTDRQTEFSSLDRVCNLHSMQRGKNHTTLTHMMAIHSLFTIHVLQLLYVFSNVLDFLSVD